MKFDIHELKQSAGSALERAGRPAKRLVLIFAAVNMALSILTVSLSGYLAQRINDAVGLAGASTRAGLAVLQMLLSAVMNLVTIMWSTGYTSSMLEVYRGQSPNPKGLTWGFRHWKNVLTATLMMELKLLGFGIALAVGGTIVLSILRYTILLSWITLLGLCVLTVWFVLRYRLTTYLVCDNPNLPGSWMPGESARIMKGKMWQFLRVDLSLWWYYLLMFLASAFLYATTLLELARVQVSLSPMAMDALTVVGYGLVSFILEVLFLNRVQLTYTAAYEALLLERE